MQWDADIDGRLRALRQFDRLARQASGHLARFHLADDERHGSLHGLALVAQRGLHADCLAGNIGHCLHGNEVRRGGEDQRHGVENAGDIPLLLEIEAVGIRPAHGIAVRADANQDFVAARLECGRGVKIAGRETGHVVAEQGSVEEDPRAEHRLGNFQPRHGGERTIEGERAAIPEGIALGILLRIALPFADLGPRRVKRRRGQRYQARHRHAAIEICRGRVHLPLGDLPRAVERDRGPMGQFLRRYGGRCRQFHGPGGTSRTQRGRHVQGQFAHHRVSFAWLDCVSSGPSSSRVFPTSMQATFAGCNGRASDFTLKSHV